MKTKLLLAISSITTAILSSCTGPAVSGTVSGRVLVERPFICGTIPHHDSGGGVVVVPTPATPTVVGSGGVCPGPILHPMPRPTVPEDVFPRPTSRFTTPARVAPIIDHDSVRRAVTPATSAPARFPSAARMAPVASSGSLRSALRPVPSSPVHVGRTYTGSPIRVTLPCEDR